MQKFYSVIAAVAVAVSASASVFTHDAKLPDLRQTNNASLHEKIQKNPSAFGLRTIKPFEGMKQHASRADEGIIYEAPEGKTTVYSRSSLGFLVFWGYIFDELDMGSVGEVVEADGKAYIKNPFSQFLTNSYLVADIVDDKYVVSCPQPIYSEEDEEGVLVAYASVLDETTGELAEEQTYSFTVSDGKIVSDNGRILGITIWVSPEESGLDEPALFWAGYGDCEYVFTVNDSKPVTLPAGVTATEEMSLCSSGKAVLVKAAEAGDKLYIQGFNANIPEAWVEGTVSGDKVTFASGQFLGADPVTNHFAYFYASEIDSVYDPDYEMWDENLIVQEAIEFNRAADGTLSSKTAVTFITTAEPDEYGNAIFTDIIRNPVISSMTGETTDPATPILQLFQLYTDESGWGYIGFTLPNVDTNGKYIDPTKLSWELLIDNEPFTFLPDEYIGISEAMTVVPWMYTDAESEDIIFYSSDNIELVYYYFEGFETIGVRSIYEAADGSKLYSAPAVYKVESSSLSDISAQKAVKSVETFDLMGRKVSADTKGLVVKRTIFADGSVKSEKSLVK